MNPGDDNTHITQCPANDTSNSSSALLPLNQYERPTHDVETARYIRQTNGAKWGPLQRFLENVYLRIPILNKLAPRAAGIILLIALLNALVWAIIGVILRFHQSLTGTAILAYTLGLRHALDADHISAIDLTTRRLIASGQRPVTVGTWFSLGHSTIVIITATVVAATATAISHKFNSFSRIGGIVGSSVSSAFLLLLGAANAYIFWLLVKRLRVVIAATNKAQNEGTEASNVAFDGQTRQVRNVVDAEGEESSDVFQINGGGILVRVFKKLFRLIDRPWKMYPLGVMFGLGFDTSSEVALLGLSALQASRNTSLWLILIYPVLFTAGMCLNDTIDGALMMSLYTSAARQADPLKVLYYNVILTGVTVLVAIIIGVLQLLSLVVSVNSNLKGRFWDGVQNANDKYDVIGGAICGLFVVTGIGSVVIYSPWRKWVCRPNKGKIVQSNRNDELDAENGALNNQSSATKPDATLPNGNSDLPADRDIVPSKTKVHPCVETIEVGNN